MQSFSAGNVGTAAESEQQIKIITSSKFPELISKGIQELPKAGSFTHLYKIRQDRMVTIRLCPMQNDCHTLS